MNVGVTPPDDSDDGASAELVEAMPVEPATSSEPPTVELNDQPVDEVEQLPAPAFD